MTRKIYFAIFFTCSCLLGFAWFIQNFGWLGVKYPPCPLCILQRLAFLAVAICSLLAGIFYSSHRIFHYCALSFASLGLLVALRHQWVIANPQVSCGLDPIEVFINQFEIAQAVPSFFKADGFCTMSLPPILLLSISQWSLVFMSALLILFSARIFFKAPTDKPKHD